jgi:NAD(P)-dependent dehydrogenase (short-subunit alcohol dehydrogenase family)
MAVDAEAELARQIGVAENEGVGTMMGDGRARPAGRTRPRSKDQPAAARCGSAPACQLRPCRRDDGVAVWRRKDPRQQCRPDFTTIESARFRRAGPQKFWQVSDDIVRAVIETNYLAADQMVRRVAPVMVDQGWGRIVNVRTKLDTMNRPHTSPYGASKAALEMATEVWAKEVAGTGLTINIVNPGAGANTPGMAEEMRAMSREGRAPRLVEPEDMVPPLLYVVSPEADNVNGWRFDANLWDPTLPPVEAARRAGRPAGFEMHQQPP